jgi:hypothetical protein
MHVPNLVLTSASLVYLLAQLARRTGRSCSLLTMCSGLDKMESCFSLSTPILGFQCLAITM